MYGDVATLIYKGKQSDDEGFDIESIEEYEIYADINSVKRTEFYAAMQAGMKPSISISTRVEEYEQTKHIVNGRAVYAQYVMYDNAEYKIIRSYSKDDGMIDLTLSSE